MNSNVKPTGIRHWGLSFMLMIMVHSFACADDNTWTFNAGLGSSKSWNLVGVTKEFFMSDHATVFVTAGLGEMILGGGVAYYGNRNGSSFVASAVAGTGLQFALTYRSKLGASNFLVVGGSYISVFGFSDVGNPEVLPIFAYEYQF